MNKELINSDKLIENKIHTLRGKQVMLDRDIAEFYNIKARRLREQVNRNKLRFPDDFCFILNKEEVNIMVSQNAIPSTKHLGGSSPYVFTEQGVAMLSSVIKSEKAIEVNIKIIRAFISMRNFLFKNKDVFNRLNLVERRQIEQEIKTDKNFEKVFNALQLKEPKQGVFFEGQIFDAYLFITKLIKKAKREIILVDNYIDESILEIFTKTKIDVKIYTKNALKIDIEKVQKQHHNIKFLKFDKSHDRFLIIDEDIYHIGASLKDLGKTWFAFSKIEQDSLKIIEKLAKNTQ